MATVDDIDTKAVVEKFLRRELLTPKTDDSSDTGEEVQALLEAVANAFLLFPQSILPIILRAKNSLRQIADTDLQAIDFLIKAVGEVNNPDPTIEDTSDLVEAQTALLELDRLGRISEDLKAYGRYEAAVRRFMEDQLGPSLKRRARHEFERTGTEAREDVFTTLPNFLATHRVMADNLAYLSEAVSDFQSVDLNRMVSSKTILSIRNSLDILKSRVDSNTISLTVVAIELLGGSAAMKSITDNIEVYAPTIETGEVPTGRAIYLRPEAAPATMVSFDEPWKATYPTDRWLVVNVDPLESPDVYILELPDTGVKNDSGDNTFYVTSSATRASPTYDIPANSRLYVRVDGYGGMGGCDGEWEVPITSGTRTVAQILADLNDPTNGLWFGGNQIATAAEFKSGSGRFIIYVNDVIGSPTGLMVRSESSGLLPELSPIPTPTVFPVVNTDPSVHVILGFSDNQTSLPAGQYSAESLKDSLEGRLLGASIEVEGSQLRITSDSDSPTSSLLVGVHANGMENVIGFPTSLVESQPGYAEIVEGGVALDPASEGVFVGSVVTSVEDDLSNPPYNSAIRTLNNEAVDSIVDTKMYFASSPLPRGEALSTSVYAPVVKAVQDLTVATSRLAGEFEEDFRSVEQSLIPVASKPTPAQINDALRSLNRVRDKLTNDDEDGLLDILDSIVVRPDRSQYSSLSDKIIKSLEERGLDRAIELISSGRFSDFFALTKNVASKSSRLMRAMEESMLNDVPVSFIEEDVDEDARPTGVNYDDVLLDRELTTTGKLFKDV